MPATAPNASTLVKNDLACVACHYNLRTQRVGGKCPECGLPIRETLSFPHLSRSAPRWLVSLLDSVTVLLVASAIAFASLWLVRQRDTFLSLAVPAAAWGTAWFGVWLLTRPEPGVRDFDAVAWAWTLRVLTTVGYGGVFLVVPIHQTFGPYAEWATLVLLAFLAPATCLYYNHLRRAAARLPSPRLAVQSGLLQLVLPLAVLAASVRLLSGRGPQSMADFLTRAPLVGLGSVGEAVTFVQVLRARVGLWHAVPLSTGLSAVSLLASLAVLAQFRFAFAKAVCEAGGR